MRETRGMSGIEGVLHLHYFQDAGYEIDLAALVGLSGASAPPPAFRAPAADCVRFDPPPLEQALAPVVLESGETLPARIRYLANGVMRLELDLPFRCGWEELVTLAAKWIWSERLDREAGRILDECAAKSSAAIKRPAPRPLREDYAIVEIRRATNEDGSPSNAPELVARHGGDIARIVRGETSPLSAGERDGVLGASMSYFPSDLFVAGYAAALVYDEQPEGARPILEILEYANMQLLEYRVYDEFLTPVLADVHRRSSIDIGLWSHWRGGREAGKLNTLRLETMELTERTDNAIKFLGDMYYARAHRLASARIGAPDYRRLVEEKLGVAGELYRFMMDRSHQASALVLESIVVIILIVDLIVLFRGKP